MLYLALGILLFILTALDIIKTTLSPNGGGKITNAVTKMVWGTFFLAAGKRGKAKLLEYAGSAILVCILLAWVLLLWSGLFLMLLSDTNSIVNSNTMLSAGALEKLYYAGFTLSTLGVGDYVASSSVWRVLTSVAAFSGLVFITVSITYFVPVLSAVNLQSKLSLYISSMGSTPQQILLNSWKENSFAPFFDNISDLCQMILQHSLNHHAFPVVHYFHNSRPKLSIAPALVLLDETNQLLKQVVSQEAGLNTLKMNMLQTTLDAYLEVVKDDFIKKNNQRPEAPTPDLQELQAAGIPMNSTEDVKQYFQQEEQLERRKLLTTLLKADGWSWQEVYQASEKN